MKRKRQCIKKKAIKGIKNHFGEDATQTDSAQDPDSKKSEDNLVNLKSHELEGKNIKKHRKKFKKTNEMKKKKI